jgi:hypothetical protein
MNVDLRDWLKNGWLTEHQTSRQEIADLLGVIDRDTAQCQIPGLGPDWQLNIAYNAALQVATAALAAAGYLASREAQHYRVIQSLADTMGVDTRRIAQLQSYRKKRNISDYERAGGVSQQEAREMIALASELRTDLTAWLAANHPELLIDPP